jgi:hypothetical protein
MNHNKLTGSSTRSNNILCFNSTVRPGFYQHRYFDFPLNVRCKGHTMRQELQSDYEKYQREQHLH